MGIFLRLELGSVGSQWKAISLSPHEENELIQGAARKAVSVEELCPSSGRKLKMRSANSQFAN